MDDLETLKPSSSTPSVNSSSSLSSTSNGEDEENNKKVIYPYWKLYLIMIMAACNLSVVIVGWSLTDENALSGLSVGFVRRRNREY